MPKKVLIVEDDGNIAELLHLYLEKEGFETQVAQDGGKGVELFRSFQPDLVLLDIMLPIMDGWSVLKKIREGDKTPVIMLTAKGETEDKVTGLEQGADDYIVKPFEMKEVLARIHAVLRRTMGEEEQTSKKLTFDKLVINLDSYELLVDGQRVDTPPKETEDKVTGLEQGADDYIVKPFEMKEVLARIHAVLRRTMGEEEQTSKKLTFDKLVINLDSYELLVDGQRVDTPPKELELLFHLASAPNRVFTRNQLLDEVWGFDYFGDSRTVDVHIKRLREKLENVSDQWRLKTVWGVGYKFEVGGNA